MSDINLEVSTRTISQCLKETSNFGDTIYHNICTGTSHTIPWGSLDWTYSIVGWSFFPVLILGTFVVSFFAAVSVESSSSLHERMFLENELRSLKKK